MRLHAAVFCFLAGGVLAFGYEDKPKAVSSTGEKTLNPRAKIETTLGDFVVELNGEKSPGTVANFAKYAEAGYYDNTVFHRVISASIIQGGGMTIDMNMKEEGLRDPIRNEWRNGLKNERGTIALARLGNQPDSGRASFYINVEDNTWLDTPKDGAGYTVFGKVVEGMDVVEKIRNVPVTAHPKMPALGEVVPMNPVVISSIRLMDAFDYEKAIVLAGKFEILIKEAAEKAKLTAAEQIKEAIRKIEADAQTTATRTPSGLTYVDFKIGKGLSPSMSDTAVIHYKGTFPDGAEFDNTHKNPELQGGPAELALTDLIKGFSEGLQTMKVGGRRVLIIPPNLGYGDRGRPSVPPNATLIYDIELIAVK